MILRGCECAEAFVGDVPGEAQPGLASRPSDFSIFNGKPKWLWTLNHSLREKPWVLWEFSLIHIIHVAQSCQDLCRELVNKGLTESLLMCWDLSWCGTRSIPLLWAGEIARSLGCLKTNETGSGLLEFGLDPSRGTVFLSLLHSSPSHLILSKIATFLWIYRYTYNMIYTYTRYT